MAKYLDENGLLYYNQKVNAKLDKKVDKVTGKGLSTNDYTTAEKNKLANIEANAQVNAIESIEVNGVSASISNKKASVNIQAGAIDSISVNGTKQTIDANKNVNITVPTNNNQLTNGAGYQTASQVQTAVNNAIKDITSFGYEVVTTLPTNGTKGIIYLVPNSGAGQDVYDEYIWIENKSGYEKIGNTNIDLSNYWSKDDLKALTNEEIDAALA